MPRRFGATGLSERERERGGQTPTVNEKSRGASYWPRTRIKHGTHLGASALTVRRALRLRTATLGAARVLEAVMACMVLAGVLGDRRGASGPCTVTGVDVEAGENGGRRALRLANLSLNTYFLQTERTLGFDDKRRLARPPLLDDATREQVKRLFEGAFKV